jgi:hydrogenase maturation factor HypF (carbamoyltransferase family)
MEKKEREMCTYCGKWFETNIMKTLPENWTRHPFPYCPKCYPGVYQDASNLPWNKHKPS